MDHYTFAKMFDLKGGVFYFPYLSSASHHKQCFLSFLPSHNRLSDLLPLNRLLLMIADFEDNQFLSIIITKSSVLFIDPKLIDFLVVWSSQL